MLLAEEAGISTCAQEAWSLQHSFVKKFVKAEKDLILFCGLAIGFEDKSNPINKLNTSRQPINNWTTFL